MRYIILLPVLSSASAFLSSHLNHSQCIERCNERPFKVAIKSRRAECTKACTLNRYSNGSSQTEDRDASCISHCNAQKGSKRFKSSCRARCPKLDVTVENVYNKDEDTENSVSQNDSNVDHDPVLYLPVDELAPKASTPAPMENSTQGTTNSSSMALYPPSTSIQVINNMSHVRDATESVLNTSEELGPPSNSSAAIYQSMFNNNGGKLKTLSYGSKSSRAPAMSHKVGVLETVVPHVTTPALNKTISMSPATEHKAKVSDLSAPSLNEPSAASYAAPAISIDNVGLNHNASQPAYVVPQVDSPLSLDADLECQAKCNEKRTLKRKRDACMRRCGSNAPSSTASSLKRGYNSAKFEL